jgi:RNA polymerase sigma-70 factor, ECF subfamily
LKDIPKTSKQEQHRSLKTPNRELAKLVDQAKVGSEEAFAKLYDHFFQPLYRYLYYRVNQEAVEDLLETVFLKAWRGLNGYKHGDAGFSAWIFRIAHNVVVDYYRSNENIYEIPESYADSRREASSTHILEQNLNEENLKKGLEGLSDAYRQIVVLKFINELSNKEIAIILGKSENSVRILQFRALKALKQSLEDMGVTDY